MVATQIKPDGYDVTHCTTNAGADTARCIHRDWHASRKVGPLAFKRYQTLATHEQNEVRDALGASVLKALYTAIGVHARDGAPPVTLVTHGTRSSSRPRSKATSTQSNPKSCSSRTSGRCSTRLPSMGSTATPVSASHGS
jgi:hypothetical protein